MDSTKPQRRSMWPRPNQLIVWGGRFLLIFLTVTLPVIFAQIADRHWYVRWDHQWHFSLHFATLLFVHFYAFHTGYSYYVTPISSHPYDRESAFRCIDTNLKNYLIAGGQLPKGISDVQLDIIREFKLELALYLTMPYNNWCSPFSRKERAFYTFLILLLSFGLYNFIYAFMIIVESMSPNENDEEDLTGMFFMAWMLGVLLTVVAIPSLVAYYGIWNGWFWAMGRQAQLARREALKANGDLERKDQEDELVWWVKSLLLEEVDEEEIVEFQYKTEPEETRHKEMTREQRAILAERMISCIEY